MSQARDAAHARGRQVTLHAHAAREAGAVTALVALLHARSGEVVRARPRALLRGQSAVIEARARRCPPFGRALVRARSVFQV